MSEQDNKTIAEGFTPLLPCPFCGEEARLYSVSFPTTSAVSDVAAYCTECDIVGQSFIYDCDVHSIYDLPGIEAQAIAAWNHRLAHTARSDAGDEDVKRVARAIDEASVGHSINLTRMVDGEAEYTAVVGDQEPRIFPSYSDASDYVETFRRHARARAALAAIRGDS